MSKRTQKEGQIRHRYVSTEKIFLLSCNISLFFKTELSLAKVIFQPATSSVRVSVKQRNLPKQTLSLLLSFYSLLCLLYAQKFLSVNCARDRSKP